MPSGSKFIYKPLAQDAIRLLHFSSTCTTTDIVCTLRHENAYHNGDNRPSYLALSYCWGDSSCTKSITVDDSSFEVTENLWQALSYIYFYHTHSSSFLWVDALCINQADIRERNSQVRQMWRIFSSASKVLAWTGLPDETTSELFAAFSTASSCCPNFTIDTSYHGICTYCQHHFGLSIFKQRGQTSRASIKVAQRMLRNRPYFSRAWIATEIAQAPTLEILCGEYTCSWEILVHFEYAICGVGSDSLIGRHALARKPSVSSNLSLLDTFKLLASSECSDPRDRIFAMLGHPLVRKLDPEMLMKPDYSISREDLVVLTLAWLEGLDALPKRRYGSYEENHGLVSRDLLVDVLKLVFSMMVLSPPWFLEWWVAFVADRLEYELVPVRRTSLRLDTGLRERVDCGGPYLSVLITLKMDDEPKESTLGTYPVEPFEEPFDEPYDSEPEYPFPHAVPQRRDPSH